MNPVTRAYRRINQIPKRRRLAFLLSILFVASIVITLQIANIRAHCYAVTYSLGNGRGIIFYTGLYDDLPAILQESVRDHEERHLQVGSYAFWRHNELEIDAYDYQIEQIDRKMRTCRELGRFSDYYLLKEFRKEMIAAKRTYQGFKDSKEPEEGD